VSSSRCLLAGRFRLGLDRPLVMGIVNVTPDSFSDGGNYFGFDAALAHARHLIAEGADMLDIGGESTRPGAQPVHDAEELKRVIPLLNALRDCGVPLSVDTRKPTVMRAAIDAGADMINDVLALRAPSAFDAVGASNAALCLMHMQGDPTMMQQAPQYRDVVVEVREFLRERVAACVAHGIARERVVIDPGFGFGKSAEHNLALLRHLRAFTSEGVAVLVGLSRKATLGVLTGRSVPAERVHASVAAALVAAESGAAIVRVHDVAATVDALKVWHAARCAEVASAPH
jgi:dihydropteroate synthase